MQVLACDNEYTRMLNCTFLGEGGLWVGGGVDCGAGTSGAGYSRDNKHLLASEE